VEHIGTVANSTSRDKYAISCLRSLSKSIVRALNTPSVLFSRNSLQAKDDFMFPRIRMQRTIQARRPLPFSMFKALYRGTGRPCCRTPSTKRNEL
jgi:succinate dehydrogenase/fumarate reductase flavoprotein subunit